MFSRVDEIKGIGPKTLEILQKSGISLFRDLVYYLPRAYENFTQTTKLSDIRPGKVVVRGKISDLNIKRTSRRNFTVTEGVIRDDSDAIRVIWFNQPYRTKAFEEGKEYYFSGNYELSRGRYQLTSPKVKAVENTENEPVPGTSKGGFTPIYSVKGSFKSENFKRIFQNLRGEFAFIPDLLPESEFAPDYIKPGGRSEALFKAHFAENEKDVAEARRYLAFEELFELILAAALNKKENQKLLAPEISFLPEEVRKFVAQLPFPLTNAQRRASFEILKDMEKSTPMNRLLQGDVGAGKTVVAAMAAFQAAKAGYQAAILAPTAILATQHAESLSKLLEPFGISIALLIGATKHKEIVKNRIKAGDAQVVIGTHALITDDTEFSKLGLVVIDEQHRFGVKQRQKLLEKTVAKTGRAPHLLMMTATPIPRSLQLAVFGDLDVSVLNEVPKGRQAVKTEVINEIQFADLLYPKVREILQSGQQVYWICKVIEDPAGSGSASTKSVKKPISDAVSVKRQTEKLKKVFPGVTIEFLHGKMKADEKDEIMSRFSRGEIQILVSTTVVEVGVNVPNANLMVIMNAEGYGLAQLHQLRGRVGRGTEAAFCYLVAPEDTQPSRRLKELEKSSDGFHLAEVDLEVRGPGEIYGSLQHGALNLKFASLTDSKLISEASSEAKAAAEKFASQPELLHQYPELEFDIKKYQQITRLN